MAAININLLPTELKVSTGLTRVLSIVRMVGVISLAAFLIFGMGLGAFFIYSSIQLNNLNTANGNLKNQLSALNTVESQYFVTKDRVDKAKIVLSLPNATETLVGFEPFVTSLTNTKLSELDITPGKVSSTINFNTNADISSFINSLSASSNYRNVTLGSVGFSPNGGYLVNMSAITK